MRSTSRSACSLSPSALASARFLSSSSRDVAVNLENKLLCSSISRCSFSSSSDALFFKAAVSFSKLSRPFCFSRSSAAFCWASCPSAANSFFLELFLLGGEGVEGGGLRGKRLLRLGTGLLLILLDAPLDGELLQKARELGLRIGRILLHCGNFRVFRPLLLRVLFVGLSLFFQCHEFFSQGIDLRALFFFDHRNVTLRLCLQLLLQCIAFFRQLPLQRLGLPHVPVFLSCQCRYVALLLLLQGRAVTFLHGF
mmetsp:Transcript_8765/g.21310  ORF Transcript_8765/g.21310 Transcript_8765/m.21310 type:complete len:253 (+) Transcript_8765:746-1504(+)